MVTLYKPQPPGTRFAWFKPLFIALLAGACWTFAFSAHAQSSGDIGIHLQAIKLLSEQAMQASRAAEQAATVADVKAHADAVFETVWGMGSGLADGQTGAAAIHGWKTRWQVDNVAFDEGFAGRYGTKPPEVENPALLGIVGRGRHARKLLLATLDSNEATDAQKRHAGHVIAALNNVIIGEQAGLRIRSCSSNVLIGRLAGQDVSTGVGNTFVGLDAGGNIATGGANVCIGSGSARSSSGGTEQSVCIGGGAGDGALADRCVIIGHRAQAGAVILLDDVIVIGSNANSSAMPGSQNLTDALLFENIDTFGGRRATYIYAQSGAGFTNTMLGNNNAGSGVGTARDIVALQAAGANNIVKLVDGGPAVAVSPVAGGYFYVLAGALHWVDSAGVDTTIAPVGGGAANAKSGKETAITEGTTRVVTFATAFVGAVPDVVASLGDNASALSQVSVDGESLTGFTISVLQEGGGGTVDRDVFWFATQAGDP